jgi:hypothetical protein
MAETIADIREVVPSSERAREVNPHRAVIVSVDGFKSGGIRITPPILAIGSILELAVGDCSPSNAPELIHVVTAEKATLIDFSLEDTEPSTELTEENIIVGAVESLIKILGEASSTELLLTSLKNNQGE